MGPPISLPYGACRLEQNRLSETHKTDVVMSGFVGIVSAMSRASQEDARKQ